MREMLWVQRGSDATCVGDLPARETCGRVSSGFLRHCSESFASATVSKRRRNVSRCLAKTEARGHESRWFDIGRRSRVSCRVGDAGDPERPPLRVLQSLGKLASAFVAMSRVTYSSTMGTLLTPLGFARQSDGNADECSSRSGRDAQCEHLNSRVAVVQAVDWPVVSDNTTRRKIIGNCKHR